MVKTFPDARSVVMALAPVLARRIDCQAAHRNDRC
jgi:hypothetical protein